MKKTFHYLILIFIMGSCTTAQIQQAVNDYLEEDKLTTQEVTSGLKEALVQGITKGSNSASATDGYFKNSIIKIPFPEDAKKVETKLRQLGLGGEVDKFVMTLNRGAELAAKEAKPIFVSAITSMTIADAWSILKGNDNAATVYLEKATGAQLKNKFLPIIRNSLKQTSATKYYGDLVGTYNKIPFIDKVDPDLDNYASDLAIQGLFTLIAKEELNIRDNPTARATDLLKKVFGSKE